MNLHLDLGSSIAATYADESACDIEYRQDAMIVRLKNGITLTVRYAAPDAYSLRWTHGDAEAGIDTAPVHPGLSTFPNHFHHASGRIVADPITRPGAPPQINVELLIRALIEDPMLGMRKSA